MRNSFLKTFIDIVLGMTFFFILPLVSVFAVPEFAFRISGGNGEIAAWVGLIYVLLLGALIITLFRMAYER